jgi:hypothetical protein
MHKFASSRSVWWSHHCLLSGKNLTDCGSSDAGMFDGVCIDLPFTLSGNVGSADVG